MRTNIIHVPLYPNKNVITTTPIYSADYGWKYLFSVAELPMTYSVYFSNYPDKGTAKRMIGNANGVDVPTEYIKTGLPVYAWLFLHPTETSGIVEYRIITPNQVTPVFSDEQPTPEQQSEIDQLIIALNTGVEAAEGYRDDAQASAEAASGSAEEAGQSASDAAESALAAGQSAENAAMSESNARIYAERAEDAADTIITATPSETQDYLGL